jgi:hypothetical protein
LQWIKSLLLVEVVAHPAVVAAVADEAVEVLVQGAAEAEQAQPRCRSWWKRSGRWCAAAPALPGAAAPAAAGQAAVAGRGGGQAGGGGRGGKVAAKVAVEDEAVVADRR